MKSDTIRQVSMLHDQGAMDRVKVDNVLGDLFSVVDSLPPILSDPEQTGG
jgi:hypothetical protein